MPGRKQRRSHLQLIEDLNNLADSIEDRTLAPTTSTPAPQPPPAVAMDPIQELTKAIQALQTPPTQSRNSIKPPTYNGSKDVELFLSQFRDVARINNWTAEEHLLHYRLSLTGKAMDCSRGTSIDEVTEMRYEPGSASAPDRPGKSLDK